MTRIAVAVVVTLSAATTALAQGSFVPVNGFPNWSERVLSELTNRSRVAPSTDLSGCSGCSSAELSGSCYTPTTPLAWSLNLNRSARFHSTSMARNGFFAHDTPCALKTSIDSLYPDSCDALFSCSCDNTASTTTWQTRISYFGATAGAENVAYGYDPYGTFYQFLYESAPSATCAYSEPNGHRWNILKNGGPSLGTGYIAPSGTPYTTMDFGSGNSPSKIVSGAHWGTSTHANQEASIDFWANWYDSAAPLNANVYVDGTAYPLSLARGTTTNGAWSTTIGGLGSGCHRYYFAFTDSGSTVWRYPSSGTFGIGTTACADWAPAASAVRWDFDGDRRSEILWHNVATGATYIYRMSGTSIVSQDFVNTVPDTNWQIVGTGDFDGDSRMDILWRNSATGQNYVYLMNGATIGANGVINTIADPNWKVAGTGDFDGDGKWDILWRNMSTGVNYIYFMNGLTITAQTPVNTSPTSWQVAGVGDFNGDGKADILWRNSVTGQNYIYLMNGATIGGNGVINVIADQNWQVSGIGDFNADGKADILWHNAANGQTYIYFMNGLTIVQQDFVNTVPSASWQIVATGDYNADGVSDILWRNTSTGQDYVYIMSGSAIGPNAAINTVADQNWKVIGK